MVQAIKTDCTDYECLWQKKKFLGHALLREFSRIIRYLSALPSSVMKYSLIRPCRVETSHVLHATSMKVNTHLCAAVGGQALSLVYAVYKVLMGF